MCVSTCHRLELYGSEDALAADARLTDGALPAGASRLLGQDAAGHLIRVAVGLESAVVGEDQVLHQLRRSLAEARGRGPVDPALDRLFDVALRAGRRARSWFPPAARGLAETAIRLRLADGPAPARPVLIVGAGEMGRRAAWVLRRRAVPLLVASRTPERATGLAAEVGATAVPMDPGPDTLAGLSGAVVALAGEWSLCGPSRRALAEVAWVVDMSAPPALPATVRARLGSRLTTIDDLARTGHEGVSARLRQRLEQLAEATLAEWLEWCARANRRAVAASLAEHADRARSAELAALWRRAPDIAPEQRAEIERMTRHLAERLLRDPLEQLADDGDGAHAGAARALFRL